MWHQESTFPKRKPEKLYLSPWHCFCESSWDVHLLLKQDCWRDRNSTGLTRIRCRSCATWHVLEGFPNFGVSGIAERGWYLQYINLFRYWCHIYRYIYIYIYIYGQLYVYIYTIFNLVHNYITGILQVNICLSKGKVPFRIVDRDDGDSQDRRLLEENWMEAGREEEEATRCEGTLVFPNRGANRPPWENH